MARRHTSIKSAQRDVRSAIDGLVDALTAFGLVVDMAVERIEKAAASVEAKP